VFAAVKVPYAPAKQLIITEGKTSQTTCNVRPSLIRSDASVGPFYCSVDGRGTVFLPTITTKSLVFERAQDFRRQDYRTRDFAFALIVAHEWGHHVQHLLKIAMPSIRLELQADCLAGIWAYSAFHRSLLEQGDIEEGMRVANSVGDRPEIKPGDPRAHGTSKQRVMWFLRGYSRGRGEDCDTKTVPIK
jgi:predicted metalloprotease